ncbi:uncharacterized protein MELLADRAFT_87235 [Melampsora larici-populina 98AG31]|uniref:Uncharacterized protein n=1 Tax=Melampsora larici-populina (strain 98AG31 / pathotype 3-4-7) TaxID=747676 RepID=F4R2Y8_MELLP|nr:uncharacterized protein MELLADRAFT_87235 [Melampsora larici-populina 98AG31]EGG12897.1 hypothetical protein MELLADRAFT_87235 [Melampsora larici-populina 98AG31]
MAEVLVLEDNGKSYEGGLLSDVTYRFFNHGYLLTTSMYCEKLERFVPVLLSWINGLSKAHYKVHFKTLLVQISTTSKSDKQKRRLCEQVVDFSQAQKVGFMEAYMEVFDVDRDKALSKLHGCKQHFSQAITRIKNNCNIVRFDLKDIWVEKCMALLEPNTLGKTLDDKFAKLYFTFPNAKRWLDWWCIADTQSMLFPGRKRMPLDDPPLNADESKEDEPEPQRRKGSNNRPELHSTTNGQESMHRVYYLLCKGKCGVIPGLIQLLAFVQSLERDFHNTRIGVLITYGSSQKNWEELVKGLKMKKPTKRRYLENDGRPPDTTDELLGNIKTKSAKGRAKQVAKGPGRPRGSQNINRAPLTTYQSYTKGIQPGTKNRCWQSATLESLYALFGPLWSLNASVNGTGLVHLLYNHLTKRSTAQLEGKNLSKSLSAHQNTIHKALTKLSPTSYIPDQFASADQFMEKLVHPGPNSLRPFFEIPIVKTYSCPVNAGHTYSKSSSIACIQIFPYKFVEAGLSYGDLGQLIDQMTTDGISTDSGLVCRRCHPETKEEKDAYIDADIVLLSA